MLNTIAPGSLVFWPGISGRPFRGGLARTNTVSVTDGRSKEALTSTYAILN
jgi:hypothetical protein